MEKIIFECETITPMFLAGADGTTPELRAPSIKGALRFWWRALNGHLGLHELKAKEDEIFGGPDNRSSFGLRVSCDEFKPSSNPFNQVFTTYEGSHKRRKGFSTNAMFYLGYGPANYDKDIRAARFFRPYIPVGTSFKIKLNTKKAYQNILLNSLKALEQFGGLGSKSRNAFGCFKINNCSINGESYSVSELSIDTLKNSNRGSYTSFSKVINVFDTNTIHGSWETAFKEIAQAYQYARENIDSWHKWDWRELIAQPIIVKGERKEDENPLKRHSKPYFMHICKNDSGYKGQIFLLPYKYLEKNEEVKGSDVNQLRVDYYHALDIFNELLSEKLNHSIKIKIS